MDGDCDVTIVGAGIAGASLAAQLAPRARVALVEREAQPGQHSTGRSAAMFMESYGPPQARALTRASRAFYAAPPAGFSDVPLLSPRGVLYVAWNGQQALLDETERRVSDGGSTVHRRSAAQVLAAVPVLRAAGLLGALAEPDAMDIDVHALHQGWLRAARRAGAALHCGAELAAAAPDGAGWRLTLTDGRSWRCTVVVDAAGAWADEVATRCGAAALGLEARRRSAFTFDAPEASAGCGEPRRWPTVAAIDESWYFKPDAGQLLGSPANADPVPPHDVVAEEIDVATGIHRIEAHTTLRIRRPHRAWAGLRTFARDGELVIGFDPDRRGLFWLAGQGGYGIQSAHGAAQLAAALIDGRALPDELQEQGVVPAAMDPARPLRR